MKKRTKIIIVAISTFATLGTLSPLSLNIVIKDTTIIKKNVVNQ